MCGLKLQAKKNQLTSYLCQNHQLHPKFGHELEGKKKNKKKKHSEATSKREYDDKPTNSCHILSLEIMFNIVYSRFIFMNLCINCLCIYDVFIEFMYFI